MAENGENQGQNKPVRQTPRLYPITTTYAKLWCYLAGCLINPLRNKLLEISILILKDRSLPILILYLLLSPNLQAKNIINGSSQKPQPLPPLVTLLEPQPSLLETRPSSIAPKSPKARLNYRIDSDLSWLALSLSPGVIIGKQQFFWQASLGGFSFDQQLWTLYGIAIGYSFDQRFSTTFALERASINKLLPYAPQDSFYQGIGFYTEYQSNTGDIAFANRLTLADMQSNNFISKQLVLVDSISVHLLLLDSQMVKLRFNSYFDFSLDLNKLGNKLALRTDLPIHIQRQKEWPQLIITPLIAYVQLANRQIEGAILEDFLYQPNSKLFATSILDLHIGFYIHPLWSSAIPILKRTFIALLAKNGVSHLEPQALSTLTYNSTFGLAGGLDFDDSGTLGIHVFYNIVDKWQLKLYVSSKW